MPNNNQLIEKIAEIYDWLDSQIRRYSNNDNGCEMCGKCCDFDAFDHRLFVTSPELMYLKDNLAAENIKQMNTPRCPYNIDGKCTIYKYRFTGCRIFSCKADKDFQSQLSESAVKKFKSLCNEFQIPYRYLDLPSALSKLYAIG